MKTVKVSQVPSCDFCRAANLDEVFDAPTTRESGGKGRWAHMCGSCFGLYGIDTSVTVKLVPYG